MSVRIGEVSRRPGHRSDPVVFIEHLGIAPWNQAFPAEPEHGLPATGGELRGLGRLCLIAAIDMSRDLGFGGRVALVSEKEPRTIRFYVRAGMKQVPDVLEAVTEDPENALEPFPWYEFDEVDAADYERREMMVMLGQTEGGV